MRALWILIGVFFIHNKSYSHEYCFNFFLPKYKRSDVLTTNFERITKEFELLLNHANDVSIKNSSDIFFVNHIQDEVGNIFERMDHPLFNSVGLVQKREEVFDSSFRLYLGQIFRLGADERKLGTLFQVHNKGSYITVNLKRLKDKSLRGDLPKVYKNVYDDYLSHLKKVYSDRMGINGEQFLRLKNISDQVKNRSQVHFFTSTQIFEKTYNPNFTPRAFFPKVSRDNPKYIKNKMNYSEDYFITDKRIENNFNFKAGAISVRSNSPEDLLPMEILHNIKIPRPFYDSGNYAGIAEVGRFSVVNSLEESLRLVKMAAFELTRGHKRVHNISKIYIEVDRVRKRLFQKYGFKEHMNIGQSNYYQSGTDFIMVVDIQDFLRKVLKE